MESQIYNIVKDEFNALIEKIEVDFKANYKKKRYNFLLTQLDKKMTAHMVFVSSFESKSGNSIQKVARQITTLRYGIQNVPNIVNPRNINLDKISTSIGDREQIIVTDIDIDNADLKGNIKSFMAKHGGNGTKSTCSVNHDTIKELLQLELPISSTLKVKPVDLAFKDEEGFWNIMEIKAGGDLDSSNAPANAEKLLTIYTGLNYLKTKPYFATIYNKNGETSGKTWSGAIKKHLQYPNMYLIGSKFWEKILPLEISFEKFTEIYGKAIEDIDLNAKLNQMINETA